ncbi:MAG: hypothetical protein ACPL3S_03120, partial [Halothiobacillaceae bacterium]
RESLEERYAQLNPVLLRKRIEELQTQLLGSIRSKQTAPPPARKRRPRSVTSFVTQRVAVRLPG